MTFFSTPRAAVRAAVRDVVYPITGAGGAYPGFVISQLALAGDSISDQNSLGVGPTPIGFASQARMLSDVKFEMFPRSASSAYTNAPDFDFGYGSYSASDFLNGNRGGDGVYPMTDIATDDPEAVFICLGNNASPTSAADIFTIWDTFLAAGRKVFAAETTPRVEGASGYDSDDLDDTNALNAALKVGAAARGIPFLEWASTVALSAGGFADPDYFAADGVHPNTAGAAVMGAALLDFLDPWLGDPFAIPADGSSDWVTSNPYMAGDVSGGATGWTFPGGATKSKVTDGDGTVWQRVTMSPWSSVIRQSAGTTTATAGDIVRPIMRIRGVSSGWDITNISIRIYQSGTGAGFKTVDHYLAGLASVTRDAYSGVLLGPEFEYPAGGTGLFTYITPQGSGTFDFRQAGIIKVG